MRTEEILNAIAAGGGVSCIVTPNHASIATLYQPRLSSGAKTLFTAALALGQKLLAHDACPEAVTLALEQYDRHSQFLSL